MDLNYCKMILNFLTLRVSCISTSTTQVKTLILVQKFTVTELKSGEVVWYSTSTRVFEQYINVFPFSPLKLVNVGINVASLCQDTSTVDVNKQKNYFIEI
jgi:hypothetical protein